MPLHLGILACPQMKSEVAVAPSKSEANGFAFVIPKLSFCAPNP
eukprot:COSAG02_NODE_25463_length_658_cov_0.924866_1_plen_43_part_10